jgi:hypothetical protein
MRDTMDHRGKKRAEIIHNLFILTDAGAPHPLRDPLRKHEEMYPQKPYKNNQRKKKNMVFPKMCDLGIAPTSFNYHVANHCMILALYEVAIYWPHFISYSNNKSNPKL